MLLLTSTPAPMGVKCPQFIRHSIITTMSNPTSPPAWLAWLTHEFRTPISSLNASLEFLIDEMGGLSAQETRELYHTMRLSVTALQTLTDNLLNHSSLEAGRLVTQQHPVFMLQTLSDAIHIMQPVLNRREQLLRLSAPVPVPLVLADPNHLRQIWLNLLMNASKYSPQRQAIDIRLEIRDGMLWAAVDDRGGGISPEDYARIFQPFVRLDGNDYTEEAQGTGLGLAVVKGMVEQQGGHVGVEASPQGGARFWFSIPIAENEH